MGLLLKMLSKERSGKTQYSKIQILRIHITRRGCQAHFYSPLIPALLNFLNFKPEVIEVKGWVAQASNPSIGMQENYYESKASLGYIGSSCHKKNK